MLSQQRCSFVWHIPSHPFRSFPGFSGNCKENRQPHTHSTKVAETLLVHRSPKLIGFKSMALASTSRPSVPRTNTTSKSKEPELDSMALKTQILTKTGFSKAVAHTTCAARKPVSARAYHRVWSIHRQWCLRHKAKFKVFSIPRILEFLQEGLSKGLPIGSLKSEISVLFQRRLAIFSDVRTFMQGVTHVAPLILPSSPIWDLNLVLWALQKLPFEPLGRRSSF